MEREDEQRLWLYSFMVTSIDTDIESLEPIGVQTRSEDGYSNNSISAAKLLNGVEESHDKGKICLRRAKNVRIALASNVSTTVAIFVSSAHLTARLTASQSAEKSI